MATTEDINIVDGIYNSFFDCISNLSAEEVRSRSLDTSAHRPKSSLISLSEDGEDYHVWVQRKSDKIVKDKLVMSSNSSIQLKYVTQKSQQGQFSKIVMTMNAACQQYGSNKDPALNQPNVNNVVNVQLNYDINQALDPESWDSDFRAISLYRLMEHLTSDVKHIKVFLSRMWKYILEKSIESNKANDLQDLKGVGKVAWEFLLAIYKTYWDSLSVDNSNTSFRNKVKSKFNPQANKLQTTNKVKKIAKPTFISALSPSILAKSHKEVNELSKYFKINKKQGQKKSYAQASTSANLSSKPKTTSSNIVLEMFKINETFPHLHNKKINQVQKIISGTNDKLKPWLNMTTKSLLQKQVIIPITKDMANQFIKDSSMHIININCALKGLKSSIITDFICVKDKDIIIT